MTKISTFAKRSAWSGTGATIVVGGSGAGHALPQRFIDELAAVYRGTGRPRDLTTVRMVGIGDFADRGLLAARPARAHEAARSAATSATSRASAHSSRRTSSSRIRSRRACCPS